MIPRIVIRERNRPPLHARARVEGWLRWELVNRAGRVTRGGEQHNLTLDQGLDQIATYGLVNTGSGQVGETSPTTGIQYACVGTDSTAPDESDTALGAEVARTQLGPNGTHINESIGRTGDGVYAHVRSYEFDFGEANGNLAEWGISPIATPGSNLYSRELFRDGGGSPEPVTKTSDDKLRLVYTREITITPTAFTPGSLVITGHGTIDGDYRLIGGDESGPEGYMDLRVFSHIARGVYTSGSGNSWAGGALWLPTTNLSGIAYADKAAMGVGQISATASSIGFAVHEAAPDYTPGSFERDGAVLKFETNRGNFEHYGIGITGKGQDAVRSPRLGFIFDYDPSEEWTKDNLHELRVTMPTVTWARV